MKMVRAKSASRYLLPWIGSLLFLLFLLGHPTVGVAFDMAGPRSMGMGGAFVAVTDDATAVYWNPAAITQIKGVDVNAFAGVKGADRIYDIMDDLEDWDDDHPGPTYSRSEMEDLQDILKRLNEDDAGASGDAAAGVAVAAKWFAISSVALGQANLDPYADTDLDHLGPDESNRADNDSRVDINSLITNNIALTLASTLGIPNLALGVNLKYIQAFRYTDSYYLFDQSSGEYDDINYKKRFNDNKIDGWALGLDAGVLVILGDIFKIGVLGRNMNEPEIDWEKDQPKTKLRGQYRAGAALTLFETLTLSVDADITEQGREVIQTKSGDEFKFDESQEISAGFEWWLLDHHLALRGGVNNLNDSGGAGRFYTAGLGFRIPFLGFDLAGGYGGDRRYCASAALNLRF